MALPSNADMPNYPFPAVARTYDFEFLRLVNEALIQHGGAEGIAGASTDLAMTATTGLGVSVAAGRAFVKGDDRSSQGSYYCYIPAAQTATATAAHATLPRVDRVVLRVYDADVTGSQTKWAVEIIAGTATAGATLSNLSGAASVPNGALLLYNLLVPATFTGPFVAGTHFQDRRFNLPIAGRQLFNGHAVSTSNVTSNADLCNMTVIGDGVTPVSVPGRADVNMSAAGTAFLSVRDGASGTGTLHGQAVYGQATALYKQTMLVNDALVPAFSGSKTLYLYLAATSATATANGSSNQPSRIRAIWAPGYDS